MAYLDKMYVEACNGINVEQNQNIIIEIKNFEYAFYFAEDVKGVDIQKLSEAVINSGDEYWIKSFYEDIPHDKFDVGKFETYLTFM